jgi:hypothetical protein
MHATPTRLWHSVLPVCAAGGELADSLLGYNKLPIEELISLVASGLLGRLRPSVESGNDPGTIRYLQTISLPV